VSDLRDWQANVLAELANWRPTGDHGFLIEATPGAGKTRVAIESAKRMIRAGRIARIVVVVPTGRLEEQWAKAFAEHGITINAKWHGKIGALATDEFGVAATYSEIIHQQQNFRKLMADRPTLLILDEVHHCGDEKQWGKAIRTAAEPAAVKLLLSGTPFRSDNEEIPFVNYIDGSGTPDFRYGYREALEDRVVRAVFFPRRGGTTEWTYKGEKFEADFDQKLRNEDAKRRLRTAVSPQGQWLPTVLREADEQLTELRQSDPTAGAIVFCEDTPQVDAVIAMLSQLGRDAVRVTSDQKDSSDRIESFAEGTDQWLVSIRQVSEGVDVPRLRIGVYATPWLTELFFRQVVGRLVRRRDDEEDPTAFLYIPDDERLRQLAQQIRDARDHVLNSEAQEAMAGSSGGGVQPSLFAPISSTAVDRGTILDENVTATPEQMETAAQFKKEHGIGVSTPELFDILNKSGYFDRQPAQDEPVTPRPQRDDTMERKKTLRGANNTFASRIHYAHGIPMVEIHGSLNGAVGVKKLQQCSVEQLEARLNLASRWLADGSFPVGY
jgi:superfamily II DNA or RNA helicase